jgi:hypothetical protein
MKRIHPSVLVYLVYALISMIQSWTLLKRLSRTTITTTTSHRNNITRTCSAEEWHLWLGRVGILVLTIGTMMDNSRHFLEGLSWFWPEYLQTTTGTTSTTNNHHTTADDANRLWSFHRQSGAPFLKTLFAACCLLAHEALTSSHESGVADSNRVELLFQYRYSYL